MCVSFPIALAFDSFGNLYIANEGGSNVTGYTPGGGAGKQSPRA